MRAHEDADRYAREHGVDALDRQTAEAEHRFVCCGELRVNGHHPLCHKAEPETAEVIEGQASLL